GWLVGRVRVGDEGTGLCDLLGAGVVEDLEPAIVSHHLQCLKASTVTYEGKHSLSTIVPVRPSRRFIVLSLAMPVDIQQACLVQFLNTLAALIPSTTTTGASSRYWSLWCSCSRCRRKRLQCRRASGGFAFGVPEDSKIPAVRGM